MKGCVVHLRHFSEVSIFRFCLAGYGIESPPETCEQLPCFCSSPRASHWISRDFLSWRTSPVRESLSASPLRLLSLAVSCEPSGGGRRSPRHKAAFSNSIKGQNAAFWSKEHYRHVEMASASQRLWCEKKKTLSAQTARCSASCWEKKSHFHKT